MERNKISNEVATEIVDRISVELNDMGVTESYWMTMGEFNSIWEDSEELESYTKHNKYFNKNDLFARYDDKTDNIISTNNLLEVLTFNLNGI